MGHTRSKIGELWLFRVEFFDIPKSKKAYQTYKYDLTVSGNVGIGTSSPVCKLEINSNDAIKVPTGTTVERPSVAENGMIRYNVDSHKFEGYANGSWVDLHSWIL